METKINVTVLGVVSRTNSIPSFNGSCCKLTEIALDIILGCMYDVISLLIW